MQRKVLYVDVATTAVMDTPASAADILATGYVPPPPESMAWASVTGKPNFGTASLAATGDFATPAQGTKADSAVQPAGLTKAAVGLGNCDNTSDANKPVSTATQTALNGKQASGSYASGAQGALADTAVQPAALTSGLALKANLTPTGGTVTQLTNKATGVTLNTQSGAITMNAAALAAAAEVTFIVTNSQCGANDLPYAVHKSAGTAGAYSVECNTVAAGSFRITVGNWSAGSLSEAIVLQFLIHKGAVS